MPSLLRRWAGPFALAFAGAGVEVSGVESQALSVVLFAVALVWGGWAIWTSRPVQEAKERFMSSISKSTTTALASAKRLTSRKNSSDQSEIRRLREEVSKCKQAHAEEALAWFAKRVSMNFERMKSQGHQEVDDIRVTVRFAVYADFNLAKEYRDNY